MTWSASGTRCAAARAMGASHTEHGRTGTHGRAHAPADTCPEDAAVLCSSVKEVLCALVFMLLVGLSLVGLAIHMRRLELRDQV